MDVISITINPLEDSAMEGFLLIILVIYEFMFAIFKLFLKLCLVSENDNFIGLPFVPSYLGQSGIVKDMKHGFNYASAGAGMILSSGSELLCLLEYTRALHSMGRRTPDSLCWSLGRSSGDTSLQQLLADKMRLNLDLVNYVICSYNICSPTLYSVHRPLPLLPSHNPAHFSSDVSPTKTSHVSPPTTSPNPPITITPNFSHPLLLNPLARLLSPRS
ncbi:hypothetical protein OSB04_027141 [Centaurea solstitialis]|uniref:Uncharacterized protein n=1 Tax=Centaurea solstitialis TaxID=347529 RepID=A0AA38W6J9_9ASTR|nr:hypothetical protein OSB04_027141 [Centaurea solstitialis]